MRKNAKYTALEILQSAGIEKPEEKIGKVAVKIAGISGIVDPNKVIHLGAGMGDEIVVQVGEEVKNVVLDPWDGKETQTVISEGAKASLKEKPQNLRKVEVENEVKEEVPAGKPEE